MSYCCPAGQRLAVKLRADEYELARAARRAHALPAPRNLAQIAAATRCRNETRARLAEHLAEHEAAA